MRWPCKRAQLEEARLSIEKTKIHCPFDARVDQVTARKSQAVVAHFQIATLTDMEALELSVAIDPRDLRWIDQKAFADAGASATAPEAQVTWTLLGQEFSWRGRVKRLERLDETTRTAHVVVEIRDILPSVADRKGEYRTLLSVGMFCRAELPMEPLAGALVVPGHAIHDGQSVYVFVPETGDANQGHLAIKHVSVLRRVEEDVLVAYRTDDAPTDQEPGIEDAADGAARKPLQAGDQIVTSPLPKAVEGMRLALRGQRPTTVAEAGSHTRLVWGGEGTVLGTVTGVR